MTASTGHALNTRKRARTTEGGPTMRRFNYRELRRRLPALARVPLSRRAERYLREHFPNAAKELPPKAKTKSRRDGVRVYTITMMGTARGVSVPHLRMSGRWLEKYGFGARSHVFVTVEK